MIYHVNPDSWVWCMVFEYVAQSTVHEVMRCITCPARVNIILSIWMDYLLGVPWGVDKALSVWLSVLTPKNTPNIGCSFFLKYWWQWLLSRIVLMMSHSLSGIPHLLDKVLAISPEKHFVYFIGYACFIRSDDPRTVWDQSKIFIS